ncbi:MAG: hypothetical protein IKI58_07040 [Oscillospiraceae bacterium]|nr:hypothetical protein [Oscillospiraceae bacterium]
MRDNPLCGKVKGNLMNEVLTGDPECDAYDSEYDCGGVYHHNYMDVLGSRDHDCWWDCTRCKLGIKDCNSTTNSSDQMGVLFQKLDEDWEKKKNGDDDILAW